MSQIPKVIVSGIVDLTYMIVKGIFPLQVTPRFFNSSDTIIDF